MQLHNPKPVRDASWVKPVTAACLTSMAFVALIFAMGSVFSVSEPGMSVPLRTLQAPVDIFEDDIWKGRE